MKRGRQGACPRAGRGLAALKKDGVTVIFNERQSV